MWKSRLTDSQKLMVFLGGMDIVEQKLQETQPAKEQEKETDPLKLIEIERTRQQAEKNIMNELRSQIVGFLSKSEEVKDTSDMFKESPMSLPFNPIMFVMHLPLSSQETEADEPDRAEVEDFLVVYDGMLIMVCAVSPLEKRPFGVYDVRDRFLSMMKSIVHSVEMTSPCLTHEAIVYVNEPKEVPKPYRGDIYIKIEPKETISDVLRDLYTRLVPEIRFFYGACDISKEATMTVEDIANEESKLLLSLKAFLATTWRHPFRRTETVRQMKMHAMSILEKMSEYSALTRELKDELSEIEERRAHNSLFDTFVDSVNLDRYTKPEIVDSDSLIRTIEHTRSETESYGSFVSTLVSTLVGALIGSALTIAVSYLVGFL